MDIWTTSLALGGFCVAAAVAAGVLGSAAGDVTPTRGRRVAVALLMALSVLLALAIGVLWLLRLLA